MTPLAHILSVGDAERAAQRRLPRCVWGYLRGGTEDERSLRENRDVFARLGLVHRGLNDVHERTLKRVLLGQEYEMPVGLAPTGLAAMIWHECDAALARAAHEAHVPFIISGSSSVPLEVLLQKNPDSWYQAYFPGDRERIGRIIERLERANVRTLVVTIDTAVAANRENNARLDFTIPFRLTPRLLIDGMCHPRWTLQVFARTLVKSGVPRFANFYEEIGPPVTQEPAQGFRTGRDRLTWSDIAWIRERWKGALVLKGVLHPEDAQRAVQTGVDAVIVSNHGGRQLDGSISPLQALPKVVQAVPEGFPVLVDGGFRRGTDVVKALALGAQFVFVGRAPLFGAALAGYEGIKHILTIFRTELDRDLALLGCTHLDQITADHVQACGVPSL
jgi:L-lactate dehydrogenase (cytochrome)